MTAKPGDRVTTLLELVADCGVLIPAGSRGEASGWRGDDLVLTFEDRESEEKHLATAAVWDVLPPRGKRQ